MYNNIKILIPSIIEIYCVALFFTFLDTIIYPSYQASCALYRIII